jgi:hypothetical protein
MQKLLIVGFIVYLLNIPFGYWRSNVKKLSAQWFLAIHIAVAIVIALRLISHLGFAWYTYIVMVAAFFLGQQTGAFILKRMRKIYDDITSCLIIDIYRYVEQH